MKNNNYNFINKLQTNKLCLNIQSHLQIYLSIKLLYVMQ